MPIGPLWHRDVSHRESPRPGPWVRRAAGKFALLLLLLLPWVAPLHLRAELPPAYTNQLTIRSVSGQFVVHANRTFENVIAARTTGPSPYTVRTGVGPPIPVLPLKNLGPEEAMQLDPRLVGVMAERAKRALLSELGLQDRWQGKIHIFLQPVTKAGQPVLIVPQRFRDGWQYSLAMSRNLGRSELNRGLVEAMLVEIANRDPGAQLVQPPLWLAEGLASITLSELERDPLANSQSYLVRNAVKPDRLLLARTDLQNREPLSFTELSLPQVEQLADPSAWTRYRASALLLTHELLSNPATRNGLRETLRLLPQHLNWQTAFLRANREQFSTLLDVEKWWAVNVASFKSHDPALLWSRERCLDHLASLVTESADIRTGTNAPVSRQQLSLSQVVLHWSFDQQREVLERKTNQLRQLWSHAGSEIGPLVAGYFQTLSRYLAARSPGAGDREGRMEVEPRAKVLAKEAARRLEALDRQLAALRNPRAS